MKWIKVEDQLPETWFEDKIERGLYNSEVVLTKNSLNEITENVFYSKFIGTDKGEIPIYSIWENEGALEWQLKIK